MSRPPRLLDRERAALFELVGAAGSDDFKRVQALVK
jgi:hypothetical protein